MSGEESKFWIFIHARSKFFPHLPFIDKKSEVGPFLYDFGQTQCLRRPWYAQHYKFWGSPFKGMRHSNAVKIALPVFLLSFLLVIIPLAGFMSVPYPISTTQNINFSGDRTVDFNDYVSNSPSIFLSKDNVISYQVTGNRPFSFAIWDKSFSNFPLLSNRYTGSFTKYYNVTAGSINYFQLYLSKGDTINYTFSGSETQSGGSLTYFITYSTDFNNSAPYVTGFISNIINGTFTSPKSQNYYFGWKYDGNDGALAFITSTIQYNISGINLTSADLNVIHTQNIQQNTFSVPTSGNYHFYLYFDLASNSVNSSKPIDIYMNIIFHQKLTGNDNWKLISPYLTILSFLMALTIFLTYFQQKYSRKFEKAKKIYYSDFSLNRACYHCRELVRKEWKFCLKCGAVLKDE